MDTKRNPCSYVFPCRDANTVRQNIHKKRYNPLESAVVDALPRYTTYSYMPPAYYAKGFSIIPTYKKQFDFTEMKKLLFLEDPTQAHKWGQLRKRLPYPENRVVDLPGTRDLNYKNYCMRSLSPESAMSWRKSLGPEQPKAGPYSWKPEGNTCCNNKSCPFLQSN